VRCYSGLLGRRSSASASAGFTQRLWGEPCGARELASSNQKVIPNSIKEKEEEAHAFGPPLSESQAELGRSNNCAATQGVGPLINYPVFLMVGGLRPSANFSMKVLRVEEGRVPDRAWANMIPVSARARLSTGSATVHNASVRRA